MAITPRGSPGPPHHLPCSKARLQARSPLLALAKSYKIMETQLLFDWWIFTLKKQITFLKSWDEIEGNPGHGWWLTAAIPALWEAKMGGSPEPKRSRPAWATQMYQIFRDALDYVEKQCVDVRFNLFITLNERKVKSLFSVLQLWQQNLSVSPARHFGRPRQADYLKSGVRDHPGQHGETPSLLKIQKLAGHGSNESKLVEN
ncbi:hypothetical protein AAY473_009343 [Plecturocebus cupreus]